MEKIEINISELMSVSNNLHCKDLNLSLQSFCKRVEFSHIYFKKFCDVVDQMVFDGVIKFFDNHEERLNYESYSIAFFAKHSLNM